MKVYKYPVLLEEYFDLDLPEGAQILSVQTQCDKPFLWALVDPDAPVKAIDFIMVGTGHPLKEDPAHLFHHGTFQIHDGALVFHLFEVLDGLRFGSRKGDVP